MTWSQTGEPLISRITRRVSGWVKHFMPVPMSKPTVLFYWFIHRKPLWADRNNPKPKYVTAGNCRREPPSRHITT